MSQHISKKLEPKFTLIMPTYNRAYCIKTAIDSVLSQTYQNFELLIIDDNSSDNTKEYLKTNFQNELKNSKIRYYYSNKKLGASGARNLALKLARYEWIGYIDSDNKLRAKFLETYVSLITVYNHKIFYTALLMTYAKVAIGCEFDYAFLLKGNFIDLGVIVHHISVYKELGGFDESLKRLEDWDLAIRYTSVYPPMFYKKILLEYNDNPNSDRVSTTEDHHKYAQIIKDKHAFRLKI